jgi:hypothetical protein
MDDFGAKDKPSEIDEEGLKIFEKALNAIPRKTFKEPLLYARVDLLKDNDDKWILTELELVEPSLFFRHSKESIDIFIDCIEKRLQN